MTLLYQSPDFAKHRTDTHPESPARVERIAAVLAASELDQRCTRPDWTPVGQKVLSRVHDPAYIEQVEQFAGKGGGHIEADTVVSSESFRVARLAAGAACDAVQRIVQGPETNALCLVRPPGHHARKQSAMGFCLFNNVAVAARFAIDRLDVERVLIVDWDVHHGNGTQEAFWSDPQVAFLSIHRWPFYPGTGAEDETGGGKGLGTICNIPIQFGTKRDEYLRRFASTLGDFADRVRPQLVLLSAGFDSHRLDPIGSLGLETEDFVSLSKTVLAVANQHASGKLVSVLEGGYNLDILAQCVSRHLETMLGDAQ